MRTQTEVINVLEKAVLQRIRLKNEFQSLLTVCGNGKILGLTIMLVTGEIGHFNS